MKLPMLHSDGDVQPQLRRVQLPDAAGLTPTCWRKDGNATGNKDRPGPVELRHPRRRRTTATGKSIYQQQQTLSADGYERHRLQHERAPHRSRPQG